MNEQVKKIFDACGIYISPYNMDASMKEIDFLCERIVLKCARICEHNETMTGKELSTAIMDEFGLKLVKRYLPDDGPLSDEQIAQISRASSAASIPSDRFTEHLFDEK